MQLYILYSFGLWWRKEMKKYEKVGSGYANKNPKHTPNSKHPMFTGELTINEEKVSIALWRNESYGKESFSIQATKVTDE